MFLGLSGIFGDESVHLRFSSLTMTVACAFLSSFLCHHMNVCDFEIFFGMIFLVHVSFRVMSVRWQMLIFICCCILLISIRYWFLSLIMLSFFQD
jgi:hypothetical protein